mmetsp:Transcript_2618/g.6869  ORF Transcript_2618/g.6869 Transcript_2618/m.6869 type:complete len:215 (+) Transcript_2618:1016-1660(+)
MIVRHPARAHRAGPALRPVDHGRVRLDRQPPPSLLRRFPLLRRPRLGFSLGAARGSVRLLGVIRRARGCFVGSFGSFSARVGFILEHRGWRIARPLQSPLLRRGRIARVGRPALGGLPPAPVLGSTFLAASAVPSARSRRMRVRGRRLLPYDLPHGVLPQRPHRLLHQRVLDHVHDANLDRLDHVRLGRHVLVLVHQHDGHLFRDGGEPAEQRG